MANEQNIPTSRFGRFSRLASLGARAGVGRVQGMIRSAGSEQRVADATLATLGQLRGLAMKVGQMASYVDGMVPPEHRDIYEKTLGSLRSAAPTMSPEAAAKAVERELGAPPEELFGSWELEPFASASIGQVHRATLKDGTKVAVKVQLEGVAKAVEADLKNAALLGGLVPFGGRFGMKEQLAELKARFLEELDYSGEAERQQRFHELFASDPDVLVPRVFPELSSQRVLTTELAEGIDFDAARGAGAEDREAWALLLWRFVFESILVHGLFNADPHPGNYLFQPAQEGRPARVVFLDFGCVKEITPERLALVRSNHRLAVDGRMDEFRVGMLKMVGYPQEGPLADVAADYVKACLEPVWRPGPFHFTTDYAASLATGMQEKKMELLRKAPGSVKAPDSEWLFFNRLQLGFYSVLARLDVPVDYHSLHRRIVEKAESVAGS